ncbi:MAG TPA: hypothetical protein VGF94_15090 [Kofleriaceae bacterium]|jgi:hypothetical protein
MVQTALALLALAACGFRDGAPFQNGAGDAAGAIDSPSSGSADAADAPRGSDAPGCTMHVLPPVTNVDPMLWSADFLTAPSWNCNAAGTTTIDSHLATASSTSCALGTAQLTDDVAQAAVGAAPVLVVRLSSLTVTNGHKLVLVGDKPIVVLVAGDVVVDTGGIIDASASGAEPGPGGSFAGQCTSLASGLGGAGTSPNWGGGGGGFGTAGGQGCYNVTNGGSPTGSTTLSPLRGGCSGGAGDSNFSGVTPVPGAGGGAIEISASGTITVGSGANAANLAAGGGGGPATKGGGNAGGSGGAILLVSPAAATFGLYGAARANGGAGSSGCSGTCGALDDGGDGHATDSNQADDSSGIPGGGNGNDHGRQGGLADLVGTSPLIMMPGALGTPQVGGRGGGGGGGGVIRVATGAATMACD